MATLSLALSASSCWLGSATSASRSMSPRWAPAQAGAGPSVVGSIFATPSSGCWVATSARIVLVILAALHGNSADLTEIPAPAELEASPEPEVPPEKDEPPPQAVS